MSIKKTVLIAYILIITTLSLLPPSSLGVPRFLIFPHIDKVVHILMYTGFTFLLFWVWEKEFVGYKHLIPLVVIVLWGGLMELFQNYLPLKRSMEVQDIVANTLGYAFGLVSWKIFRLIFKKNKP